MNERLFPDPQVQGAFQVKSGVSMQSWVDPAHPELLVFEYTQQISHVLEATVFERETTQRIRVVHVGGGGLSLPRWVLWRRPGTAQIVLEPDLDLIEEVRRKLPLPKHSGIKIRQTDGRSGIVKMPNDYVDALIIDAFNMLQVPGELATREWFSECRRVLRPGGVVIMNLTDIAPFDWAKRCFAGLMSVFQRGVLGAEPAVLKGRRFGNLVATCSTVPLPTKTLVRRAAGNSYPYRLLTGRELQHWVGGANPFQDNETRDSMHPDGRHLWFN